MEFAILSIIVFIAFFLMNKDRNKRTDIIMNTIVELVSKNRQNTTISVDPEKAIIFALKHGGKRDNYLNTLEVATCKVAIKGKQYNITFSDNNGYTEIDIS